MPNQFPSTDTVKISNIELVNIPSRNSTYSVKISHGKLMERVKNKKVDGNSIVWPDSLSFTGTDLTDQSLWHFEIVKTWLGFTEMLGSKSYTLEQKLLGLLVSQKLHGCCKLTVFKGCQLKFTIERRGDALSELVHGVENALAPTSTSNRPADIANYVVKTHDFIESHEDPWMSFLPAFKIFMNTVDTISEIHPYVQLAWSILSVIPKTIISQNERDDSINKLCQHLKEIYDYITDVKRLPVLKETQFKALSILVQQTIECAKFLKEYAASTRTSKILNEVTSDIDKKVDDFNKNFNHILNVMTNSIALETNTVAVGIANDIGELKEKVEELKDSNLLGGMRHAQKAGFLMTEGCLPGTRQGLITEILDWVNTSDGGSERVFLLLGQAGMGKSAVAHAISRIFEKQNQLGSVFCFNQSDKENRNRLLSAITRELTGGDVQWRKRVVGIEEPSIQTSLNIPTEHIVEPSKPVVIVIDGLDESGNRSERVVLLDLLFKRCPELPSNYRFVITSRPEPDIEPLSQHPTVFCKRMADIDPAETTKDIQEYISSRLSSVENFLNESLDNDWRLILAERAEGVFQWANIACNVINPTVEFGMTKRVQTLISGPTTSLYQMYHQVFLSRPEFKEEDYLPAFKTVMGALLVMQRPLSIQDLQYLFQNNFPHQIKSMMAPFHSLFLGTNNLHTPVRPLHTSLMDFLTTPSIEVTTDTKKTKTIPNQFYVDTSAQDYFALACLKVMNSKKGGLRFNICNLETSHLRNRDVPDLDDRVRKEIPSHLSYASYFWAVHLLQSKPSEDLLVQLHILMRTNILYLFEALSLLEKSVDQVCVSMKHLVTWCQGIDDELASWAEDACQFGYEFGDPMVGSTPHVYISALPFTPNGSFIRDQYLDLFPRHFNIELGQSLGLPRNSNVIKRHPNSFLSAVEFSPQGRYIATGFKNGDFWLWDYKTGEMIYRWKTEEWEPSINTIVFSPNGESVTLCLLNGSFKTLNIPKYELVSHSYGVFGKPCHYSTISSNGHYLVFHSHLNEVSLYNTTSRSTIQLGFLGSESIFSPNGELLASLPILTDNRWPETILIWSIQKQKLIGPLCPKDSINAMAFSPDGNHMALLLHDIVEIWDVLKAAKVRKLPFRRWNTLHKGFIFSQDGQKVFFYTNFGIQIMDISTGVVQSLPCNSEHLLAVSSDCKHMALVEKNGAIQVQKCESTPRAKPIDYDFKYTTASLSPLNTYLLLENFWKLWIFNTATMTIIAQVQLVGSRWDCLAISPNDEYIAYAGTWGLCLWSTKHGEKVLSLSLRQEFTALAFSFGSDRLISGDESGTVRIWNTQTHILFRPSYTVMHLKTPILALAFSQTGAQFLVVYRSGSNEMIEIHSSQSGNLLGGPFIPDSEHPSCENKGKRTLAFSANETHIVYGHPWITIIMDAQTGQTLRTFKSNNRVYYSSVISPNRKHIIVTGGGRAELWDTDTGEKIDGKWRDCSAIKGIFCNNSEEFATNDKTGEINFWDISSGNKSTQPTFKSYYDNTYWGMSVNDKYLVMSFHDVEIWSLDTHRGMLQHQSNDQKPLMSSIDHPKVELTDGAIHDRISLSLDDQERLEYALVAWKNALFSESSKVNQDGWVLGPNGELLFWVPEERRDGLWKPKMAHLMGVPITKLTFDNFVHGSRWTECKEKL